MHEVLERLKSVLSWTPGPHDDKDQKPKSLHYLLHETNGTYELEVFCIYIHMWCESQEQGIKCRFKWTFGFGGGGRCCETWSTEMVWHLERKGIDDWVSTCRSFKVAGSKSKGWHKKTWDECVRQDLRTLNLKAEWVQDRKKWRSSFGGNRATCASMEKWTLNRWWWNGTEIEYSDNSKYDRKVAVLPSCPSVECNVKFQCLVT